MKFVCLLMAFILSRALALAATNPEESIYNLPSTWQDQDSHSLKLDSLKGRAVVLAMAYTGCKASCPLIVEDMKKIERALPEKTETQFVIVSFDSKRDTPTHLKMFANIHKLDKKHWVLLHGSESSVRDLAAVLGVRYRKDANGEFDHSNLISLLDTKGIIKFQQSGLQQKPETFLEKLKELGM